MDGAIPALCHPLPTSRGTTMADSKLSREHSLALLHKLANDDGFRNRYEQKPAAALAEVGVPPETIKSFMATCQVMGKLADKTRLAEARQQLLDASADACIQMAIPNPNLDFGKQ
jgi:putative modified peptide